MKKTLFSVLTVIGGMFGLYCTICAGVICTKGADYSTATLVAFLGVILPVVALEIAKVFLKHVEKYNLGIVISAGVLFLVNLIYISDGIFGSNSWTEEFIPIQFPWIVALLIQILFRAYKLRKSNK